MAKKSFKDNTANIDRLFSISDMSETRETPETHRVAETSDVPNVSNVNQKAVNAVPAAYYRFNLKMPLEYKKYLDEASWRRRMNVTQFINELIAEKMREDEGKV